MGGAGAGAGAAATGAGGAGGGAPTGGGGGAAPTIMVPFMAGLGAAGAGGGGVAGPAGGRGGAAPCGWFIMSMVPLNFGAAAPFKLKPHLVHADAVSGFWVPQFGQNTPHLQAKRRVLDLSSNEASAAYTDRPTHLKGQLLPVSKPGQIQGRKVRDWADGPAGGRSGERGNRQPALRGGVRCGWSGQRCDRAGARCDDATRLTLVRAQH